MLTGYNGAAYRVEGFFGSIDSEKTGPAGTLPTSGICAQVAPPSTLFQNPLRPPAYRFEGVTGSTIKVPKRGASLPSCDQVCPPSLLAYRRSDSAYTRDGVFGSSATASMEPPGPVKTAPFQLVLPSVDVKKSPGTNCCTAPGVGKPAEADPPVTYRSPDGASVIARGVAP